MDTIVSQALQKMKEEQGESFRIETVNLAALQRMTGISRGRLRRWKRNLLSPEQCSRKRKSILSCGCRSGLSENRARNWSYNNYIKNIANLRNMCYNELFKYKILLEYIIQIARYDFTIMKRSDYIMNETDKQEIELDLLELLQEFKHNIAKIVCVTLLFAAAAALYVFVLTPPKYSYTLFIDSPFIINHPSLTDRDKISFVNVFNEDAVSIKGHGKMWKEPKKCALFKVEFVKDRNAATNLLKFEFHGTDPDLIKKEGRAYTEGALRKINERIVELHETKYGREYFDTVLNEMRKINSSLQDGSVTSQGAAQYLQLLKERLELKEKNKMLTLIKAELVSNRVDKAEIVSRTKYIPISGFLGLFLSLAYLTGRYCMKLSQKP